MSDLGPAARWTDPVESHLAAESVDDLSETKRRIIGLFDEGRRPMTRDALIASWRARFPGDLTTDQSIRSRLAELMDARVVVKVGTTRNARNRQVQIVNLPEVSPSLPF